MKKKISFSGKGNRADIGEITIHRILPNRYTNSVGPFVFLDHMGPLQHTKEMKAGTGAHPHRGIATLTYVLNGEGEHFDSAGNHAMVRSGGIQWMKAGNGIIHDETMNPDSQTDNPYMHGFQFWINLPSEIKAEKPEYLGIQANEVPTKILTDNSGWLKVIAGSYEELDSKIPNYTEQFLYHIRIEANKQFTIPFAEKIEIAAFLPTQNVILNDSEFQAGEFVEFDRSAGVIEIKNTSQTAIELLFFGGEYYNEPIVATGPFVMNTQHEITQAYNDFYAGKYGKIIYGK
ncbi:pirin family protein [Flavobacterium piscis]|uniref:Redox-sensitive bicupin YhaK (Pirin superfamily) n=1 Tax=Flavobacterium piscis TaxID=1114874 RepID=A0ABU1YA76_9FLAO|nr:pirin family protein [Flavobacterium piscis]MDR7210978.1 redox-sensitive bicupin YhaK (pirin superfamily) [Flavobacterium piscis]